MTALSRRERRLVALGILLALVAALYYLLAAPVAAGFERRAAERRQLIDDYARQQRLLASAPYWNRERRRQRADAGVYALRAASHETASQMSKDRLTTMFRGGTIRSIRDIPAPKGWIRLQVDAKLPLADLSGALRTILTARPGMAVLGLSVNAQEAFSTGQLSPLDARVEVSVPIDIAAPRNAAGPP